MLKVQKAASLQAKLSGFPHQLEALEAIKDLPYAAVFHEQGLGKPKSAWTWHCPGWPVISSTPFSFSPRRADRELAVGGGEPQPPPPRVLGQDRNANFYAFNSPARLYLMHYEAVLSERNRLDLFLRTRRVGVVLDESQKIKNPNTEISQALHSLSDGFVRRVIMTGTPVANRPHDLWSQVRFLDGGKALRPRVSCLQTYR